MTSLRTCLHCTLVQVRCLSAAFCFVPKCLPAISRLYDAREAQPNGVSLPFPPSEPTPLLPRPSSFTASLYY